MGKNLNQSSMRFLIVAALCAIASAAPEGRRLRPEEHWRPAQGRDLSKYKPRAAMVDANGDDPMEKINRDRMGQALRQRRWHLPSPQGGEGHPSHERLHLRILPARYRRDPGRNCLLRGICWM